MWRIYNLEERAVTWKTLFSALDGRPQTNRWELQRSKFWSTGRTVQQLWLYKNGVIALLARVPALYVPMHWLDDFIKVIFT